MPTQRPLSCTTAYRGAGDGRSRRLLGELQRPQSRSGTITGLTLFHTRAHLYRVCLEGVAFALRHNVEAGRDAGYPLDDVVHVVGGAPRSEVWLEILTAVLGMPVVAATGGEAAYGDAMLAAVGVGRPRQTIPLAGCRLRTTSAASSRTLPPAECTTTSTRSISGSTSTCANASPRWPSAAEHRCADTGDDADAASPANLGVCRSD